MLVDLHVHTRLSADSNTEADAYLDAIAQAGNRLGGICFTEHRLYPADGDAERTYGGLSARFQVVIFRGIEADTDLGHLFLFGVTPALTRRFDLTQRMLKAEALIEMIHGEGGVAIPSHPFRDSGYGPRLEELIARVGSAMTVVEAINGQNTRQQNDKALAAAEKLELTAVAGSDAHFAGPDWFLTCSTEFEREVTTVEAMCEELRAGRARPHVIGRG